MIVPTTPSDHPGQCFPDPNAVRSASAEDEQVERQHRQDEDDEADPHRAAGNAVDGCRHDVLALCRSAAFDGPDAVLQSRRENYFEHPW